MSVTTLRKFYQPVAIAVALAFVYATVLEKMGRDWWHDENYSHGLLIPFVIGYILWAERERLRRAPQRATLLWGGAAITCALFALWAGTVGADEVSMIVISGAPGSGTSTARSPG